MSGDCILVMDRHDNIHLVDYVTPNGRKYTLCDLYYNRKSILTTLTMDDVWDQICPTCIAFYQMVYSDKETDIRETRSGTMERNQNMYMRVSKDPVPEDRFIEYAYRDHWPKFKKYKKYVSIDKRK